MTDILDRLRRIARGYEPTDMGVSVNMDDAADEIERLRERLKREGSGCGCHWTYTDDKDLDGTQDEECAYHMDQKRALKDEIERLGAFENAVSEGSEIIIELKEEIEKFKGIDVALKDAADEIERQQQVIANMMIDAHVSADEIEKLRADLRSAKMALQPEQKKHAKARQEIERLAKEIGHLREIIHAGADEIEKLRAQIVASEELCLAAANEMDRLRVALRDVLGAFSFWQTLDPAGPKDEDETERFVHDIEAAIARARAALEPKP